MIRAVDSAVRTRHWGAHCSSTEGARRSQLMLLPRTEVTMNRFGGHLRFRRTHTMQDDAGSCGIPAEAQSVAPARRGGRNPS